VLTPQDQGYRDRLAAVDRDVTDSSEPEVVEEVLSFRYAGERAGDPDARYPRLAGDCCGVAGFEVGRDRRRGSRAGCATGRNLRARR
jgi:hypothetical protein